MAKQLESMYYRAERGEQEFAGCNTRVRADGYAARASVQKVSRGDVGGECAMLVLEIPFTREATAEKFLAYLQASGYLKKPLF